MAASPVHNPPKASVVFQHDRPLPAVFVLKADVETADDAQLAELEIEGLTGRRTERLGVSNGGHGEWAALVEGIALSGVTPDHVLVGAVTPDQVSSLVRRLGMIETVIFEGPDGEVQEVVPTQTAFERGAGATGLRGGLNPSSRRKNEYLTHPFHKYKAKFFPRLARALLNFTTPDGSEALDPLAGSGTMNVEASLMGLRSTGVDIDPLSVFIAEMKVHGLCVSTSEFSAAVRHLGAFAAELHGQINVFRPTPGSDSYCLPEFIGCKIAEGRKLIEDEATVLSAGVSTLAPGLPREFARLALSHALATKISLRWMGTGDNRFALAVAKRSLPQIFNNHLMKMLGGLEQRDALVTSGELDPAALAEADLRLGDVRALGLPADHFGGVVTSPPYLPAASGRETYLRSRAPSLMALGLLNESEILERERSMVGTILSSLNGHRTVIPAEVEDLVAWMRPQRARSPKAEPTAVYFHDLASALREMGRVTKPGGRVALVVSAEHIFYDLISRNVVRRLAMPALLEELIAEPRNEIPLQLDRVIEVELPKMDYAARPASKGRYAEAIVIASRI